jgi:hypothetical protein
MLRLVKGKPCKSARKETGIVQLKILRPYRLQFNNALLILLLLTAIDYAITSD